MKQKKTNGIVAVVLVCLIGVISCDTKKKKVDKPAPTPAPIVEPDPPKPIPPPVIKPDEETYPEVKVLPESFHPDLKGSHEMAARWLMSNDNLSGVVDSVGALRAHIIFSKTRDRTTNIANIYAKAFMGKEFALKTYSFVMEANNGCKERYLAGQWSWEEMMEMCGDLAEKVYPMIRFPMDGKFKALREKNLSLYAAVGALASVQAQDRYIGPIEQGEPDTSPFRGREGNAFSGIWEMDEDLNPKTHTKFKEIMDAYLRDDVALGSVNRTEACFDALADDENFVLLYVHIKRWKQKGDQPSRMFPLSPMKCKDEHIPYIGQARLYIPESYDPKDPKKSLACAHPYVLCKDPPEVRPCKEDEPYPVFDELDLERSKEAVFIIPGMWVFKVIDNHPGWFLGPLDAFGLPAVCDPEGKFREGSVKDASRKPTVSF